MQQRRSSRLDRTPRIAALAVLAIVALAGCHTMRFEIVDEPHAKVVHHRKSFYIAGLFPRQKTVDVSAYCPHGVSQVREQTTTNDVVLGVATLGVWTPRSSWYSCLPGPGEGQGWIVDVPIPRPGEAPVDEGSAQ
jgi:hypothetical protein